MVNEGGEPKPDYEKVLELALEVGVGLLSCGGSVSRVETAVDRICVAYGAEEASVAAFPSMILASLRDHDGHEHSFMKRVYATSNNLALLEKYNQLSRDICAHKYPVDEALKMSFETAHAKPRNKWVTIVGSALVAGIYSIFFGGTIADVLPAFLVAFGMAGVSELLSVRSLNVYATTFLLSLMGGILSVSLCKLLFKRANLLILDEPTNHLDPDTQAVIGENFRDYTGTVLLVSHNPDFVEQIGITRMLILPEGKIVDYSKELLSYYYILNTDFV